MNILVISSNLIGDNILSSGVVKHFIDKYPHSRLTFIVGPSSAQLYEHWPNLEKIVIVKKQKFNFHWFVIWSKCFFKKWNIIIDFRSSLISYILLNNQRYIFKRSKNKHQIHQLSIYFKINSIPYPVIFNSAEEEKIVEKILINKNKYIVLAPGGNWLPKIWPAENFNQLIKVLLKKQNNLYFILVGSFIEKQKYMKIVLENIDQTKIIDLMGETLTQTYAFIKKSTLYIGNDSGLMHIASASKISTIGLFGPTNDKIYAPFGDNSYTLRTKESYEDFNSIHIKKSESYMQSLKVEQILEIIENKNLI